MKSAYRVLAVAFALALLIIPAASILTYSGDSDAVNITVSSGDDGTTAGVKNSFNDKDDGSYRFVLVNKESTEQKVVVKVMDYEDFTKDNYTTSTRDTEEVTLAGGETKEVVLSWGYASTGTKYLTVGVYDTDNKLITSSNFSIEVSHSIWKNPITYIGIVLAALVVIVIIVIKVRSSGVGKKGKKADPNQPTFTQMEEERQAKKIERKSKKR